MKHTDEETLAMLALGEDTNPAAAVHLRQCGECSAELAELRRVVTSMEVPSHADADLLAPPDHVWTSITEELRLPAQPQPQSQSQSPVPLQSPLAPPSQPQVVGSGEVGGAADAGDIRDAGDASDAGERAGIRGRPVVRGAGRFAVVLAACAALLGAAAGSTVTWWVTRADADATTAAPADDGNRLESLRTSSAGYARVSDDGSHRALDITVKGLPSTSGYFEVWLMDRTHTKLVSMGVLGPDGRATLPVPDTIDLGEYSVVDVSVQPYNGKPDHSGASIVRGPYKL
ncbi:anti-sigma factor [Streptomyces zhihengii]|uniref:Anti-sigma factor n=1 Tax=Streptomyces zhihengii TaxID=1818004 RepID=A0ABS2UJ07_9ACTN|nr:anti-sigma factor [Streptomyces zhihengii]MBM9617555.1 anti-sigma factor [Streptomyces zhihengii]